MSELFIRHTVELDAPVSIVWRVLTDSAFIQQYMFGCRAETDWQPGSPLLWIGAADGQLYVKGHVLEKQEPWHVAYTTFDPNSTLPDIPSNYLTVTYNLQARLNNKSTLEITQGDFDSVANGRARYEDSLGGYDMILDRIKQLAEQAAVLT